jgi:YVTN family beta-propeller protein
MAGQRSKWNRQSRSAKARRRRRVVGLGSGAGAFLVFGLGPLAGAPSAKADVFDDILDLAVGSAVSSAVTSVNPTDFVDPGVLSGLLGDLSTPAGWDTLLTDFSNPSSFDALFSSSAALSDTGSAASAADSSTTFVQGLEQDWINSTFGQQVDASLNTWAAQVDPAATSTAGDCGVICNGVDGTGGGTLAQADGEGGGLWFGNGGDGVTAADGQGGTGGDAGYFGNGGDGGNGANGGAGGDGGNGGSIHGSGGNGGAGGEGVTGFNAGAGGDGGTGGNAGPFLFFTQGGTGGAGGNAADGTAGSAGSAPSGATGGQGGAGGEVSTSSGGGGLTVTNTGVISEYELAVSPTGPEAGDVYSTDWPGAGGVNGNGDGDLYVYNPATNNLVATITVGEEPVAVAVSPTGPDAGDIYVSNYDSGTVSVINPGTNTVIDTINVGLHPSGIAVSPTGPDAGDVYVSDQADGGDGTLTVINPANTVVDNINLGSGLDIFAPTGGVAVSPTGPDAGDVYVSGTSVDTSNQATLVVVNPANTLIDTFNLPDSPLYQVGVGGIAVSPTGPDAGDVYVDANLPGIGNDGTLYVINLPANTVDTINNIAAGTGGASTDLGGVAVSPAGPDAGDIYVADPSANAIAVLNPTATTISYPITLGATSVAIGPAGNVYAGDEFLFVIK